MDKLLKQLGDFEKAVKRLMEALKLTQEEKHTELYSLLRDSSIQRFEFTFEIFWKLVKTAKNSFRWLTTGT
ncbi:nucleotidyltransferase substrate binding protein [Hydrogenobacter thermophilus]|uniref:nucleotidyltransferase substrate binding protein n=1 Tax=Hydrogenobacter thermophilus TaxID=940 RepID=UPI0030F940CB